MYNATFFFILRLNFTFIISFVGKSEESHVDENEILEYMFAQFFSLLLRVY